MVPSGPLERNIEVVIHGVREVKRDDDVMDRRGDAGNSDRRIERASIRNGLVAGAVESLRGARGAGEHGDGHAEAAVGGGV